jgi:hypothetical protein
MNEEVSTSNAPQLRFKTSDGKIVDATAGFDKFSLMVWDILQIQLDVLNSEPIELTQIHSLVLQQINVFVQRLTEHGELLKDSLPCGTSEDFVWNEFTVLTFAINYKIAFNYFKLKQLPLFEDWANGLSTNMLIHMSNAGDFLQMKSVVHFALAILSGRVKEKSVEELRTLLNETNEMDNDMRVQFEKAQKAHPDL